MVWGRNCFRWNYELFFSFKGVYPLTLQDECKVCNHPKDKHAFDIYPQKNPNKPCELSCMICFDEETERLKGLGKGI